MAGRRAMNRGGLDAVFVEPFFGGSHAAFARGWIKHSRHRWRLLTLPAARWKWRMRVASLLLGPRLAGLRPRPDVVVASSLLDLAHLRLAAEAAGATRFLLYVHENQFSYPRPATEHLERGFAVAHLASLCAADGVAFNSRWHQADFADQLRRFLADMPPPRPRRAASMLKESCVLPPGVDLAGFPRPDERAAGAPPVIVWNHRWEEDKRPLAFARTLLHLAEHGRDFRLILLGPVEQVHPRALELIRERLGGRILRDGPAKTRREYIGWLRRADIAVSTAAHENFGYAMAEAMAAGAVPLAPRRLAYPELIPRALHGDLLYDTDRALADRLAAWLAEPARFTMLRPRVMTAARQWEWGPRAAALDEWLTASVKRAGRRQRSGKGGA